MKDDKPSANAGADNSNDRALMRRIGLAPGALPHGGGWYPSDQVLGAVLDCVADRQCDHVVVLGGGLSVPVLASVLRNQGTIWMVEHDFRVIEITLEMMKNLDSHADVRVMEAELQDYDEQTLWYDRHVLRRLPDGLDLIFIDGPPHFCGPMPRYPAGPELFHKLTGDGSVVLDKAFRAKEKKTLMRWAEAYPHLAQRTVKGGAVVLSAR